MQDSCKPLMISATFDTTGLCQVTDVRFQVLEIRMLVRLFPISVLLTFPSVICFLGGLRGPSVWSENPYSTSSLSRQCEHKGTAFSLVKQTGNKAAIQKQKNVTRTYFERKHLQAPGLKQCDRYVCCTSFIYFLLFSPCQSLYRYGIHRCLRALGTLFHILDPGGRSFLMFLHSLQRNCGRVPQNSSRLIPATFISIHNSHSLLLSTGCNLCS